jgi:glycosyltransferase involved in cell wall biosynthesis
MKISVVVPTYNSEEYIHDTVESINAQTYKDIVVLIQDNCSDDATLNIIEENLSVPYKIYSEEDQGQADAINRGFRKATGDVITWLNADDIYFDPTSIEKVVEAFTSGDADIVYGGYAILSEKGEVLGRAKKVAHSTRKLVYGEDYIPVSAFIRKRVPEEIGYLDDSYRNSFDYEYWCRAAVANMHFVGVNAFIYGFRLRADSKTVGSNDVSESEKNKIANFYQHRLSRFSHFYATLLNLFYRVIIIVQTGEVLNRLKIRYKYFSR